jgi:hypothetical protein
MSKIRRQHTVKALATYYSTVPVHISLSKLKGQNVKRLAPSFHAPLADSSCR